MCHPHPNKILEFAHDKVLLDAGGYGTRVVVDLLLYVLDEGSIAGANGVLNFGVELALLAFLDEAVLGGGAVMDVADDRTRAFPFGLGQELTDG